MTQPAKAEPKAAPVAKKAAPAYTERERRDRVKIPFLPQIFLTEAVVGLAIVVITVVICTYWYNAPLEEHARPFITPQHTKSPWYFLWL
ncbi:MAG: hypothetical protein HY335_03340, partial [Deinococcus sp.]|nr:hypothetical protein [Deinococcus sp.]